MNLNQNQQQKCKPSRAGRARGDCSIYTSAAGQKAQTDRARGAFRLPHISRKGPRKSAAHTGRCTTLLTCRGFGSGLFLFIPDTSPPTVARRSRVDGCAFGGFLWLTRQRQTRVGERSTWRCIYRAIRPSHQLIQIPRMYQGRSVRVARQGVECLTALRPVAKFSRVALQGNAAQFGHHAPDSMSDVPHSTNVLSTYPVAYVQTHRAAGGRKIGTRVQRA